MFNKKVLIDSLQKLGSAKAPTQKKDVIVDPNAGSFNSGAGAYFEMKKGGAAGPCPPFCGGLTVAENLTNALSRATRSNYNLLSYPIKNIGYKIAKQSTIKDRSKDEIWKGILGKSQDTYFGQSGMYNPDYGPGKRDLNKLYFFGDETGFIPTNYDFSSDAGLDAMVQKYGPLKAFLLNSEVQHGEPISAFSLTGDVINNGSYYEPIYGGLTFPIRDYGSSNYTDSDINRVTKFRLKEALQDPNQQLRAERLKELARQRLNTLFDTHETNVIPFDINASRNAAPKFLLEENPVTPLDNVAGHMAFLRRLPNKEFELTSRDIWSFRPEAYNDKWSMDNAFKKAQVQLMDMFGKPFVLTQTNPIKFREGGDSTNDNVSVRESNIQGKGLFINKPMKKGEVIGVAHINDQPTPVVGKYHNHSEDNPTAVNVSKGNKRYLVAGSDLPAGTEITTNYRLQPELEQPEDFMQKGGMTPQKDGYRTYSPFKHLPFIDVESDTIDTDNIVHDLQLVADNGITKNVKRNTGLHKIPGASIIREIPMGRKGGSAPKLPGKKDSRAYSRSLEATNRLFAEHPFFAKPKSRKNKIYDPNAKYYQDGGATSPEEWEQQIRSVENQIGNPADWTMDDYYALQDKLNAYRNWRETTPEGQAVVDYHNEEGEYDVPLPEHLQDYTNGMMKAKLAYADMHGNPAAKRMINIPDNPYDFGNGMTGTHYMSSMDNYAVPQIQNVNGQLTLGEFDPSSNEAIKFDNPNDARYFAEHYKEVSPGFIEAELTPEEIEQYAKGGYVIEDISIPSLPKAQGGLEVIKSFSKLPISTPGNALRTLIYKGINPANYNVLEKVKGIPSELYKTAKFNETRPFRVGQSLMFTPEKFDTFLKIKRLTPQEYAKMPDSEKMMLHDETTRNILQDVGRRRLDAFAVGLNQPQEYGTLDQVGDNTFRMKDLNYTPEFFSERWTDLQAQGIKDRGLLYEGEDPMVTLAKQHYDRSLHPHLAGMLGVKEPNEVTQDAIARMSKMTRSQIDKALGYPERDFMPWNQVRQAGINKLNPDPSFRYSIFDNDMYGVMGGFRWDLAKQPEGIHWQANDVWDINPFERRSSPLINPDENILKYLHANYFKPFQKFEALSAVGGRPFNIQNNFLVDPKSFKVLKTWQKGGFLKRKKKEPEPMEPIKVLQPGEEAFPLPQTEKGEQYYEPIKLKEMTQEELDAYNKAYKEQLAKEKFEADKAAQPSYFDEAKQWVSDWHDSPMYQQMVLKSYRGNQGNADYLTKLRKKNIKDLPPLIIKEKSEGVGNTNLPDTSSTAAWSLSDTGQVEVFPEGYDYGPSLFTHEILHSSDRPRELYKYDHPAYNTHTHVDDMDLNEFSKVVGKNESYFTDNGIVHDYPDWMLYKDPRFPNDDVIWHDRVMPVSDQMYITTHRGSNWKDNQSYINTKKEGWYTPKTDEQLKKEMIENGISSDDPLFNEIFKDIKKGDKEQVKSWVDSDKKHWKEFGHDYVSDPTEVRARLGEIRYNAQKEGIYDPFTEQITPEIFQNYINKERDGENWQPMKPIDELRQEFTDEEILWMLQNISKNETGEDENELQYGKYGGEFELGDEVDEATMKKLKKLGYTFEKI